MSVTPEAVPAPWGAGWQAQVRVQEPDGRVCLVDSPRRFATAEAAGRFAERIAGSILLGRARERLAFFEPPAPGTFVTWREALSGPGGQDLQKI